MSSIKDHEDEKIEGEHEHDTDQDAVESGTVEALGYKQSYKRVLRGFGQVCLVIALTSPLGAQLVVAFYQISYGGYFGLVWGWLIPSIMFLPQVLAFAELCSAMPVNGSTYWWTAALAPSKWSRPLSFVAGCVIVFSLVCSVASFSWASSSALCRAITLIRPDFSASPATTMGIAMACVIMWAGLAQIKLDKVTIVFITCTAVMYCQVFGWIIGLPVSHAVKKMRFSTGAEVFGSYQNFSDWGPGVAVPFTFFAATWVNSAWTAPSYMVEGTRNARREAPKAILMSYVVTAIVGMIICIVTAFCITDIAAAGTDPTTFPLFTVLAAHWGSGGAFGFIIPGVVASMFGGSGYLLAASCQMAAFARDGGMPFTENLTYIHPRTNTPVWSILTLCCGALLILLFGLSPTASGIMFSLAVMVNLISQSIPIGLRLVNPDYKPGPFNLGRFSKPVFVLALVFMWYMIVMEAFPTSASFTGSSFNYNWVVVLAVTALAIGIYAIWGSQYVGPNLEALQKFRSKGQ